MPSFVFAMLFIPNSFNDVLICYFYVSLNLMAAPSFECC